MRTNYKISVFAAFMIFMMQAAFSNPSERIANELSDGYYDSGHGKRVVVNNHYNNNMYDFQFSSRIKRFHGPYVNVNYYGSCYTDYYWYGYEPAYIGWSIYLEPFWNGLFWGFGYSTPYYRPYYRTWYSAGYYPSYSYSSYYYGNRYFGYRSQPVHYDHWSYNRYPVTYRTGMNYQSKRYNYQSDRNYYSGSRNTVINRYSESNYNNNSNVRGNKNNNKVHINNITVNNNNTRGSGKHVSKPVNKKDNGNSGNKGGNSNRRVSVKNSGSSFNRSNNASSNNNRINQVKFKTVSDNGTAKQVNRRATTSRSGYKPASNYKDKKAYSSRSTGSSYKKAVVENRSRNVGKVSTHKNNRANSGAAYKTRTSSTVKSKTQGQNPNNSRSRVNNKSRSTKAATTGRRK